MTVLVAIVLGLCVGILLTLLGAGGAVLTVPVLVYVLGQDVHTATTTSLVVVLSASLAGVLGHARMGHVRQRVALLIGLGGAAGAVLGTLLNRVAGDNVTLVVLALVLLTAARSTWLRRDSMARADLPTERLRYAIPVGLAIGVLTGLVGVGGGFLIVPALLVIFGVDMRDAVGTSLAVISMCSCVALTAHITTGGIDLPTVLPLLMGGVVGAVVGSHFSTLISARRLQECFAVILGTVGVLVLGESATALL